MHQQNQPQNQQQIIIEDLTLIEKLGEGSFGEVYLTKKSSFPNMLFATKKVNTSKAFDEKNRKYFNNELYILRNLNHPNIIQLYEIKRTQNNFYLVFDYCNGGTLSSCLKKYQNLYNRTFLESECQYLIRQITNGLCYLQRSNIIHRDLKLDNIMIHFKSDDDKVSLNMSKAEVKIIDFGFAKYLEQNDLANSILGSPLNMDPILLGGIINQSQHTIYDEKADIWSLGTICYTILIGKPPFQASTYKELYDLTMKGEYSIPLSLKLSRQAVHFLTSMLQNDPKKRSDIQSLSLHEFIFTLNSFSSLNVSTVPLSFVINNELKLSTLTREYCFLKEKEKEKEKDMNEVFNIDINDLPSIYSINKVKEDGGLSKYDSCYLTSKQVSKETDGVNNKKLDIQVVKSKAIEIFDKINISNNICDHMIYPSFIEADYYLKNLKLS